MHLILVGMNHKSAPVEVRERVAFEDRLARAALKGLVCEAELAEAVLVSTCNRTEVYALASAEPEAAQERIVRFLEAQAGLGQSALDEHLYRASHAEAVDHLFKVAAGLDSLVVGEPQILGQVRDACSCARAVGATGMVTTRLFETSLQVGKRVRSETALGQTPVSVATISVQLAERVFGDLAARSVLVLGAGEMCVSALCLVDERHPAILTIVNRTASRAEALAERFGGRAASLDSLEAHLVEADVVLSSTSAPEPIVDKALMSRVMKKRRGQRMLLIDMAVPRDVDTKVGRLNNVYLYDIDALQGIAAEHLRQRMQEVPRAEAIVSEMRDRFLAWERSLTVVPTIVELRQRFEEIRAAEVSRSIGKLADLDDRSRDRVEQLTQSIVNKILHSPQVRLKEKSGGQSGAVLAESLRYLFALDGNEDEPT